MFKFLKSLRAAMTLGKAQKLLRKKRYREALEKAEKAQQLELEENFYWLSHSIAGKSHYHLGEFEESLVSLRKAEEILAPKLLETEESESLVNIMAGITWYIDKIEESR
jgi:tetratricopeptide (TPR) repeat protein